MSRFLGLLLAALLLSTPVLARNGDMESTASSNQNAPQNLVDKSYASAQSVINDPNFPAAPDILNRAKGIMIFPQLFKAGFLVGGEGGVGAVLVRREDGSWSYPAFYNMIGGSFGLQLGVQASEVVFLVMTDKGIDNIIKNQFKLGVDASVAIGPVGAGIGADKSALDLKNDMYVYSKAQGLFGGGAFKGAIITTRQDLNEEYYGIGATPRAILLANEFRNEGANQLRDFLAQNGNRQRFSLLHIAEPSAFLTQAAKR
ncbi:MAG: lipid-binding SYLF domain-containing protein [Dongiaceae bacterium]